MTSKKQENTIKKLEDDIINNCYNILNQDNIIVYSSTGEDIHNDTNFLVYILNENKLPTKTIFKVLGPSAGYKLILIEPNVSIKPLLSGSKRQEQIMNLYSLARKKYYEQEKMRSNIYALSQINSLKTACNNLQTFVLSKDSKQK